MSERGDQPAIWHVPLLVLAGVAAIAGVVVAVATLQGGIPAPWGPGLQWGLAGASMTFTMTRIVHVGRVGRRELELLVIAACVLLAQLMLMIAGAVLVIAVILLAIDEL